MKYLARRFRKYEDGAVLVESLLVVGILIVTLAAFAEFTMLMHWWNQGVKAVQLGSRMASVSSPVDSSLTGLNPTDPFADRVCTVTVVEPDAPGESPTLSGGNCTNGATYDEAAMRRIIFGSDNICSTTSIAYHGMCDVFAGLVSQGGVVEVTYAFGGLGYEDRLGGPVPVIRVALRDVPFPLPILDSMLRLAGLTMPERSATAVSEDLSATFAADSVE